MRVAVTEKKQKSDSEESALYLCSDAGLVVVGKHPQLSPSTVPERCPHVNCLHLSYRNNRVTASLEVNLLCCEVSPEDAPLCVRMSSRGS